MSEEHVLVGLKLLATNIPVFCRTISFFCRTKHETWHFNKIGLSSGAEVIIVPNSQFVCRWVVAMNLGPKGRDTNLAFNLLPTARPRWEWTCPDCCGRRWAVREIGANSRLWAVFLSVSLVVSTGGENCCNNQLLLVRVDTVKKPEHALSALLPQSRGCALNCCRL